MSDEVYETELTDEQLQDVHPLCEILFHGWTLGQVIDLANHGADSGWPGLTYTSDIVDTYNQNSDALWSLVRDYADEVGESVGQVMAQSSFNVDDADALATFMVWFAAEELSRRVESCHEQGELVNA